MRTTFYESKNECIITIDETKQLDYQTVIDLSKVKDILKGMALLGKEVTSIRLNSYVSFDVDTKYYHRYEESFLNRLYRSMNNAPEIYNLVFKNNRLYVLYEGNEIICPIDMHNAGTFDKPELTLVVEYE